MNKKIINGLLFASFTFTTLTFTSLSMASNVWINTPDIDSSLKSGTANISNTKVNVFNIKNMNCKMCHFTIRKAIEKVDGVIETIIDFDDKIATVRFDPTKTTTDAIAFASTNVGYPATLKK